MITIQPILRRGREVWDPINMPKDEFRQRVDDIREAMAGEGIEVLLLYGADVNGYGDPCYVSNYATRLPAGTLVILPRKGDLTLFFVGSSRELKIGQRVTWINDTRSSLSGAFSSRGGSLAGDCVNYLQENHLLPSRIGLVGLRELMSYREFERFLEGVRGSEVVDAGPILRKMRMKKSVRESDQIRRASRIVSNALGAVPGMVLRNRNERTLEAKLDWALRVQGAEDIRILLARPRHPNWAMRPAAEASIPPNDTVIIYLAVSFERYWAEGIKTFAAGKMSFTEVKNGKGNESYQQVAAGLKPGKAVSEFYHETMEAFRKKGISYIPEYGLGHGIGLSPEEPPILDDQDPNRLAEGMSLALHIASRDNERGAVMVGNTILLCQAGAEILTT